MDENVRSPRVTHVSWGRLLVEGKAAPLKDGKLYPGGARQWDWNETGTRHVPGIQPADVEELLAHGAKIVVLSKGISLPSEKRRRGNGECFSLDGLTPSSLIGEPD
jgi:hypothetical protein